MSEWWSRALGVTPEPQASPSTLPVQTPQQRQATQGATALPVRPDAHRAPEDVDEGMERLLNKGTYDSVRRRSVETGNDGSCPECGGDNYFENIRASSRGVAGKASSPRCFDCGYPVTHTLAAG